MKSAPSVSEGKVPKQRKDSTEDSEKHPKDETGEDMKQDPKDDINQKPKD